MDISSKKELIKKYSPTSNALKDSLFAFLSGGFICAVGEVFYLTYFELFGDEKLSLTLVTLSLIFIASSLTAFGIFDKIAKHAGAGTLVPVTGFANAVTSQAMDAKNEGIILGVGRGIFTVAGPVILFGLSSGTLYGVFYYILGLFF